VTGAAGQVNCLAFPTMEEAVPGPPRRSDHADPRKSHRSPRFTRSV